MPHQYPFRLSEKACELSSAALRHLRDSEALLATSSDGAFYLAGYAPEIAQKATLSERWLDQVVGHLNSSGASAKAALALALDNDPVANRYSAYDQSRWPALRTWSTDARYKRTGKYTKAQATALLDEARKFTDELLATMWAEGRFPDKGTVW